VHKVSFIDPDRESNRPDRFCLNTSLVSAPPVTRVRWRDARESIDSSRSLTLLLMLQQEMNIRLFPVVIEVASR
jgi:hypothetical protein